jgi:hypothetical protein
MKRKSTFRLWFRFLAVTAALALALCACATPPRTWKLEDGRIGLNNGYMLESYLAEFNLRMVTAFISGRVEIDTVLKVINFGLLPDYASSAADFTKACKQADRNNDRTVSELEAWTLLQEFFDEYRGQVFT